MNTTDTTHTTDTTDTTDNPPTITYVHGHPWVQVGTTDGIHHVTVAVGNLLYDEDGNAYLLVISGKRQLRLYVEVD